jgi:hypothetical protein
MRLDVQPLPQPACREELNLEPIHAPHSWVTLPQAYVNAYIGRLALPAALRLRSPGHPGRDWLVSWQGAASPSANSLQMPSAFASACGLHPGDLVTVEVEANIPEASIVHVAAASAEDWLVVQANAEHLTSAMLEQLKVVRKGDTLPIWIRGQSSVCVTVLSATPADTVQLTNGSIVSVQPPETSPRAAAMADVAEDCTNGLVGGAGAASPEAEGSGWIAESRTLEGGKGQTQLSVPVAKPLTEPLRLRVQVCPHLHRCCTSHQFNPQLVTSAFVTLVFVGDESRVLADQHPKMCSPVMHPPFRARHSLAAQSQSQ